MKNNTNPEPVQRWKAWCPVQGIWKIIRSYPSYPLHSGIIGRQQEVKQAERLPIDTYIPTPVTLSAQRQPTWPYWYLYSIFSTSHTLL